MFKPAMAATVLIAFSMPAYAAGDFPMAAMSTTLPREAVTVTDWYKQNVYDPNENKIGDIKDVLVDKSGKIAALDRRCRRLPGRRRKRRRRALRGCTFDDEG